MAQGGAQRSCLFVCLLLAWVQACYWRAGLLTPSGPKRKQLCEPPSQPAASPACPPASCPAAGFMIVREGEPVFMSPQQQHEFNFPFQTGALGAAWPATRQPASAQAGCRVCLVCSARGGSLPAAFACHPPAAVLFPLCYAFPLLTTSLPFPHSPYTHTHTGCPAF